MEDPNGWHEVVEGEHVLACYGTSVVAHPGATVFVEAGARVHAYNGAWIHMLSPQAVCCFNGDIACNGDGIVIPHNNQRLKECARRVI